MLAFSRTQALRPETIDPQNFVDETAKLLGRTLGEDIGISVSTDDDIPTITIDKTNLTNALLNIAINAKGAMPNGGKLSIHTSRKILEQDLLVEGERRAEGLLLAAGDYLEISVTDTGCGMSAGTLKQAVEPFFTTKPVGEGSGLGLSMVYGFTQQSGGNLFLESELGKGTTIRLVLPATKDGVIAPARIENKYKPPFPK